MNYMVRLGDSLGTIASAYGVTVAEILKLNRIANPDLIYPGQMIRMPSNVNGTALLTGSPEPIHHIMYNPLSADSTNTSLAKMNVVTNNPSGLAKTNSAVKTSVQGMLFGYPMKDVLIFAGTSLITLWVFLKRKKKAS